MFGLLQRENCVDAVTKGMQGRSIESPVGTRRDTITHLPALCEVGIPPHAMQGRSGHNPQTVAS